MMVNNSITKRANKIYASLQDDISRELFNLRLNAYIPQKSNEATYEYKEDLLSRGLILYGAGAAGAINYNILKSNGFHNIICFCDSASNKWNTCFQNLPIISPDELMKNYSDKSVLISSTSYYNEMHRQLVNLGFPDTQIVDRRLPTAKWPKSTEIEYFGEPFLTLTESEVFIDAGAYDGDTIKSFLKFCNGKYKKICALEPDSHNFIKLKKSIAGYNNIIALNKGAWSSNTILKFTESVDRFGSAITDTGSNLIEAIKIDDTLESDAATFIKMDIEGSELAALMGAAETIKKHKPRLAICVYHKLEDVITIPEYIQSLVPDYKFYIRHYSEIDLGTVLYAI